MDILAQNNSPADYTHYNFALLKCRGIEHVLDTLRYERAFFVRPEDVAEITRVMEDPALAMFTELNLLIAAYSWNRRPHWTHARLLSTMSITELHQADLYDIDVAFIEAKASHKLKIRSDLTVRGTFDEILSVMLLNRAMPLGEKDAHLLEHCIYQPEESVTLDLTSFFAFVHDWEIPKQRVKA
jgi:hypothetical protein